MSLRSGHQYRHQQKASFCRHGVSSLCSTSNTTRIHRSSSYRTEQDAQFPKPRAFVTPQHTKILSPPQLKRNIHTGKKPAANHTHTACVSLCFPLPSSLFLFPLRTALPGLEPAQQQPTCICLHTENAPSSQTIQHIITAPLALASPLNNSRSPPSAKSGSPRHKVQSATPGSSAHAQTGNLHGQNAFIPSAFRDQLGSPFDTHSQRIKAGYA